MYISQFLLFFFSHWAVNGLLFSIKCLISHSECCFSFCAACTCMCSYKYMVIQMYGRMLQNIYVINTDRLEVKVQELNFTFYMTTELNSSLR